MTTETRELTRLNDYAGVAVHVVNADGQFVTSVAGSTITAYNLIELHQKIDRAMAAERVATKRVISLPVVGFLRYGKYKGDLHTKEPIKSATIRGVNRATRDWQFAEKMPDGYQLSEVVADTPPNRELLAATLAARSRADDFEEKLDARILKMHGYGRIEADAYDGVVDSLIDAHKRSAIDSAAVSS